MIIVFISFILDNIISKLIPYNSLMYPLFSILSLELIYPYFNYNDNRYHVLSFFLGLIYDLAYTDTIFLNASIFLLLSYILKIIFKKFNYNYLSVLIVSIITIIYYRLSVYLILVLVKYLSFDILSLIRGIYNSLIINIIYISILYIIVNGKRLILKK